MTADLDRRGMAAIRHVAETAAAPACADCQYVRQKLLTYCGAVGDVSTHRARSVDGPCGPEGRMFQRKRIGLVRRLWRALW